MSKSWIHWTTPLAFRECLDCMGPVVLDPCWNFASNLRPVHFLTGGCDDDGLRISWSAIMENCVEGYVYVNPPYNAGAMAKWAAKIAAESMTCEIIALTALRPSARWWQTLAKAQPARLLLWGPGRLAFENPPPGAQPSQSTVESAVWYFGKRTVRFENAFVGKGMLLTAPW